MTVDGDREGDFCINIGPGQKTLIHSDASAPPF